MAVYSWYDLSGREQRAVLRLARKGLMHPDPKVARLARDWAAETLNENGSIFTILVGILVGFILQSDAGVGLSLMDRRRAKRILHATKKSDTGRRSSR